MTTLTLNASTSGSISILLLPSLSLSRRRAEILAFKEDTNRLYK